MKEDIFAMYFSLRFFHALQHTRNIYTHILCESDLGMKARCGKISLRQKKKFFFIVRWQYSIRERKRHSRHVYYYYLHSCHSDFFLLESKIYIEIISRINRISLPKFYFLVGEQKSMSERACTNSLEYSLYLIESKINIFSRSGFIFLLLITLRIVTMLTPFTHCWWGNFIAFLF